MIRLPWRFEPRIRVCVRIPEDRWGALADALVEAVRERGEQVTCFSSGDPSWGIYTMDVAACGLRRRAVEALVARCRQAAASLSPREVLVHVGRNGRCGGSR
jgi:hypothetical protein